MRTTSFVTLLSILLIHQAYADSKAVSISVDTSSSASKPIPDTLFGIFFEEINHAGVGGLWDELVMNRGFEASPGSISPWGVIGHKKSIQVRTEMSSCFEHNKVALRMDVLCDRNACPNGGVGVYNPGYGGMNIERGKAYNLELHARGTGAFGLSLSLVGSNGRVLANTVYLSSNIKANRWTRMEMNVVATATDRNASLRITTNNKGTIWLDQISVMPVDTYKGHGFRKDLMQMLLNLKPRFLRFPGGCFVEGFKLDNAYQWKETVGPWEQRPGHYGDVWKYWTDDGIGYLEFLQLAEDLGAEPVWVVNAGIAHNENAKFLEPFIQDMLDSLEFARGDKTSRWGSLRARYGHPEPFELKYVAIGNEDCWDQYPMYRDNYVKFYKALKAKYPDVNVINNCDATTQRLDVPADIYDFHIYTNPIDMFNRSHMFDTEPRSGPKAFVSEYAVTLPQELHAKGTLLGAIAEAGYLIGLERNCDIVAMASYAPLLMHQNDPTWKPNAIIFDSWKAFGIPSYWMQTFFTDSSGATLLNVTQSTNDNIIASAISYKSSQDNNNYIKVKVVNFRNTSVHVNISLNGVDPRSIKGSKGTVLTSNHPHDSNSFAHPRKVFPRPESVKMNGSELSAILKPFSLTAFDLLTVSLKGSSGYGRFAKSRKQLKH